MSLTPENFATIEAVTRTCAALSLVGLSTIVIDVFRKWGHIRVAPSRIVIWWTLAFTIEVPFFLLARSQLPRSKLEQPNGLCLAQALSITFGVVSSSLWSGFMALNAYLVIVRKVSKGSILRAETAYHAIAWGVPTLACVIPFLAPNAFSGRAEPFYGDAGVWCWITASWTEYRFGFLFGPVWAIMCLCAVIYPLVGVEVFRTFHHAAYIEQQSNISNSSSATAANQKRIQARMTFMVKTSLPLVAFILTHLGPSINRIVTMTMGKTNYGLMVFHVLTASLAGVLAAAAYFGDRVVISLLKRRQAAASASAVKDQASSGTGSWGGSPSSSVTAASGTGSPARKSFSQPGNASAGVMEQSGATIVSGIGQQQRRSTVAGNGGRKPPMTSNARPIVKTEVNEDEWV